MLDHNLAIEIFMGTDKAKAALAELNIELADEKGSLRNLHDIYADLNKALYECSKELQNE